jgi:predicted transposase YbfD/YdcC
VTLDAIGCQTEIAERIVARGGDYLLAFKGNQGSLAAALQEFFSLRFRNRAAEHFPDYAHHSHSFRGAKCANPGEEMKNIDI